MVKKDCDVIPCQGEAIKCIEINTGAPPMNVCKQHYTEFAKKRMITHEFDELCQE